MSHPLLQNGYSSARHLSSFLDGCNPHKCCGSNWSRSLLVRVSAYYHDIGKLAKPEFSRRTFKIMKTLDNLSPHMSALVIIAHVKEGLALAKKYKLPSPI